MAPHRGGLAKKNCPVSDRLCPAFAWNRPSADFGVVCEAASEVAQTQERCPWARSQQRQAAKSDYSTLLGKRPVRVLVT